MTPRDGMQDVPMWQFWRRQRYVVTLMSFFGFICAYSHRVNVSVAIVAMTENKSYMLDNGTVVYEPEFAWDTRMQGLVLSSFFYGYITTQLLGGWWALKIGGNRLFAGAIGLSALLTVVTPWLAKISVYVFIAIRVIAGVVQGVTYPAIHDVWGRWAPPAERAVLTNIGFAGCDGGSVITMAASGALIASVGWPPIFFIFGGLGLVWVVAWLVLVRRGPDEDRRMDPRERHYIQETLGGPNSKQNGPYPWAKFFTSMPVWAILVANFSANWGFYTLFTQLPTFMKDTMLFDIEQTGFLSALPSLVMVVMLPLAGHIADVLINRGCLSIVRVRKIFCCVSFVGQAVFMVLTAFLMTPAAAVTCLTIAVGIGAFAYANFFVNHLDIAPQYASILMGISNTAGTIPGIVSPILTGYIVPNKTTSEWQIVFFITSAIYVVGAIFYGIFASGGRQSWAALASQETEKSKQGL